MMIIDNILKSVPFFNHLNTDEINYLKETGNRALIPAGSSIDLKKMNSLCIVLSGMFEIKALGNNDIVYLSKGSFLGSIPFTESRKKGNVSALVDSYIFLITEDVLLKLFLSSFKALRGYMNILNKAGLNLSSAGVEYLNSKTTVLSCFSSDRQQGKSFLASMLGLNFAKTGKTIILDLSYNGKSIFDYFEKIMPAPISERPHDSGNAESFIEDRIVNIDDNLDLLNISYRSRVKVDPEIFNIVLLVLSKKYSIIIADISSEDEDLMCNVFEKSDYILNIITDEKKLYEREVLFNKHCRDGQRIINIKNEFFTSSFSEFKGGYILKKDDDYHKLNNYDNLVVSSNCELCQSVSELVSSKKRSLVLESSQFGAASYCGFLYSFAQSGINMDWIYSSSYSYILIAIMLLSDSKSMKDRFEYLFSPELTRKFLDIKFPEEFIYKNSKILKYAKEIAGNSRAEMFKSLPLCRLSSSDGARIFSSGAMSDLIAASYVSRPFYQSVPVQGVEYSSGYPGNSVSPLECCRTVTDEIIGVELTDRSQFIIDKNSYPGIFIDLLKLNFETSQRADHIYCDKKLVLDVSEKEFKFDKIFSESMKISESIIAKI